MVDGNDVAFEAWVMTVPPAIRGDVLWRFLAYRLALFASKVGWHDVCELARDPRMVSVSDQLFRSLGSISANIAEGFSRGGGCDRARFYEYALGSAREGRDWYYKARHGLEEETVEKRLIFLSQIVRLLLVMIPDQRDRTIRDDPASYSID